MANLPVKQGLHANVLRNVPLEWNPVWFRRFVIDHLQNADVRNSKLNIGVTVTGQEQQTPALKSAGVPLSTLASEAAVTVVGNPTAVSASPSAIASSGDKAVLHQAGTTLSFSLVDHTYISDFASAVPQSANPSGLIGLTAVNGSAGTWTRSDSTHALDQGISPTWTGTHKFANPIGVSGNTPPAQVTGFGTPTGTGVIANFPGATATLAQATQAIAQLIADLKAIGFYGA